MSAAELSNPANQRFLEIEDELNDITRRLNELFAFWANLDTPNHPKRRQLTGDRIAEIEAAEDELEKRYRRAFKEIMQVRHEVTHFKRVARKGWIPA